MPPKTVRGYVDDQLFDWALSQAMEWVSDLVWPLSVQTYYQMRRDARLAAVEGGYALQLRRSQWQLDGTGCRPEVVQVVADDLGLAVAGADEPGGPRLRGVSWSEHLRVALGMLAYGHAGFELGVDVSSGQARLTGLYERPQWTISHLHVDGKTGELKGVSQDAAWKEDSPQIRANALVWYAHEREGAGWQGTSLFRPAYGPWLIKREMIRVHAISNRRWGAGVPVAEALPGSNPTPQQMGEAQRLASAARAGDQAGAAMPPNFTLKIAGLSGSVPDTLAFLEWLNREMAQAALMQHLDLGQGSNGGSRALGAAFIDSWTLALESIGEHIADTATRQIAAKLVEWNWGPDERVPRVVVSGVGSRREVTAESLQLLLSSGALSADPGLEEWVRREYRLPERQETAPARTATDGFPGQPTPTTDTAGGLGGGEAPNDSGLDVAAATPADIDTATRQIQDDYERAADDTVSAWQQAAAPLAAAIAAATAAEVAGGMLVGLAGLAVPPPLVDNMADVVAAAMTGLAERTARTAAAHLAVFDVDPTLPDGVVERLDRAAQTVTDVIVAGYTTTAARAALTTPGGDPEAVEATVRERLSEVSTARTGMVAANLRTGLTAAQSEALASVYEQLPAGTGFVASEVNDKSRCQPCGQVDGRTYASLAAARTDYPTIFRYRGCLGRDRCRGLIWPTVRPDQVRAAEADDERAGQLAGAVGWLASVAAARWNPADHPRNPAGTPGAGRFRSIADRISDAVSRGAADPFAGFDREQMRRTAKKLGVTVPRGASRDEIGKRLRGHIRPDTKPAPPTPRGKAAPSKPTRRRPQPEQGVAGQPLGGQAALNSVPAWLPARRGQVRMSRPQRAALRDYESTYYTAINGQLRRGDVDRYTQRRVDRLDEVLTESRLPSDVQVARGITNASRLFGDRLDGDLTGMQWQEMAYTSTTVDRRQAELFTYPGVDDTPKVLMDIRVPAGIGGVVISGSPGGQGEIMLERGLTMRVVRDRGIDGQGRRLLDVEVVPDGGR
jgi:hypothetical protein